jgi:carbon monoxide dehydrogenase subunit G
MKLEQSFEVAAALERVWAALIDVERVAPCLPGASVTGRNDDGSYNGNFKVKIGPTSAAYSGKLKMENVDEAAHTATMQAQGTDKRGQGGAKATIVSSVTEGADGAGSTRVEVVTEYHITGRLARFGRGGMIEDISNRLLTEFATCLQTALAGDGPTGAGTGAAESGSEAVAEAAAAGAAESGSEAVAEAAAAGAAPTGAETIAAEVPVDDAGAAADTAAVAEDVEAAADAPVKAPAETAAAGNGTPAGFTPPPQPVAESEPVQGLSLMVSVLWNQAKRNPAPIAAMVLGFLLALRVFRRRD